LDQNKENNGLYYQNKEAEDKQELLDLEKKLVLLRTQKGLLKIAFQKTWKKCF
jgi:hypothetical protein